MLRTTDAGSERHAPPQADSVSQGEAEASPPGRVWLLYDGDCRICSAFARAVVALDVHGGVRIRPIQESGGMLGGIPAGEVLDAVHAVAADGRSTTGAEALVTLLAGMLGAPVLERTLSASPAVMSSLRWFYAVLASIRGHLMCQADGSSSAAGSPR